MNKYTFFLFYVIVVIYCHIPLNITCSKISNFALIRKKNDKIIKKNINNNNLLKVNTFINFVNNLNETNTFNNFFNIYKYLEFIY